MIISASNSLKSNSQAEISLVISHKFNPKRTPTDKNVGSTLVIVVDRQINTPLGKDKSTQVAKDRQQEKQHRDEFG